MGNALQERQGGPRLRKAALSAADLACARQDFFERDRMPTAPLSERVLMSWQRCRELGLEVDATEREEPLSAAELHDRRVRAGVLLSLAEPELDFLYESLADSGSMVILADAEGAILDVRGESGGRAGFASRAARVALLPGARWGERQRGTNAVGTAIADNHLVEIWGGEHFHSRHAFLCCTAAPILDHRGHVAGVVDVSGDARLPRGYARAVVKRAVREIEHRWLLRAPADLVRVHLHPQVACLGSYQEGLVLLDGERIVGANRTAWKLLGCDWRAMGSAWSACVDTPLPTDADCFLDIAGGQRLAVRVSGGRARSPRPTAPGPRPSLLAESSAVWLSRAARAALEKACRVIDAGLTVSIHGETGAGKEVFTRELHRASARRNGPFVAINCASLPESLIESELFGYAEGAFTGARKKGTHGRILEADGGILFLDEIGDMPLALQSRLLRVLQEREVMPLGGGAPRKVDCVVVCATHRDIGAMVAEGSFRADLYYRLQHYPVRLPAWREMSEDERASALDALWRQAAPARRRLELSAAARRRLLVCDWPGNLRQCGNALAALAALADDGHTIGEDELPDSVCMRATATLAAAAATASASCLEQLERDAILRALRRHRGRVSAAAQELGIHRATLYRKLREAGLDEFPAAGLE